MIAANSMEGAVLIALRAGRMCFAQMNERFVQPHATLRNLLHQGLVEKDKDGWQITEAGRAACPRRRDAKPEPLHASRSPMSRSHGWSSTRKGASA